MQALAPWLVMPSGAVRRSALRCMWAQGNAMARVPPPLRGGGWVARFAHSAVLDDSAVAARAKEISRIIPELQSRDDFFVELSALSDEEFEIGRSFLSSWYLGHVKFRAGAIASDVLYSIPGDFLIAAKFTPGAPVDAFVGQLSLPGAAAAAYPVFHAAIERKAQAAEEAAQRKVQAAEEAEKREVQAQLTSVVQKAGGGNAIWPLHRIIAGIDSMGLPEETVASLQAKFGWTLSFSRALNSGPEAMLKWFRMAGVEPWALDNLYQCASQERDAAELLDARVEDTDICGVQRVVCTYPDNEGTVDVVTSLLLQAPNIISDSGKDTEQDTVSNVPEVDETVPTVMPQLHGVHPLATGASAVVRSVPLVLTPPRIALLVRIAACVRSARGVQLTGVHGAGKSMLLQALSTVLPVGTPLEMLFVPEAKDLLIDPLACARQLSQSSGPLVDRRAVGNYTEYRTPTFDPSLAYNQKRAQEQWNFEHNGPHMNGCSQLEMWHQGLGEKLEGMLLETFTRLKMHPDTAFCGRVYIFDEVNQLLGEMRAAAVSHWGAASTPPVDYRPPLEYRHYAEYWELCSSLPWRRAFPEHCFRIMASSPDGVREYVPSITDNVFFELRPTRFDHLAAVLCAAPEFIQPAAAAVQLHQNEKLMTLDHAMHVCSELCGNMREVTRYTNEHVAERQRRALVSTNAGYTWVRETDAQLKKIRGEYTKELSERLVRSCNERASLQRRHAWEGEANTPVATGGDAATGFYKLALMNASMSVRENAEHRSSPHDLLGHTMLHIVREVLQQNNIKWEGPEQKQLLAMTTLMNPEHFCQSGEMMEREVRKRLFLQALAPQQWRLDALPALHDMFLRRGDEPPGVGGWTLPKMLRAAQLGRPSLEEHELKVLRDAMRGPNSQWLSATEAQKQNLPSSIAEVVQSKGNEWTKVDAQVAALGLRRMLKGGSLLIETAPQFPRADFIFVHGSGPRRSVTFVEVTKSTLKEHAKGAGYTKLPQSLRDLARLTERRFLTAQHEDGRWWVASDATQRSIPSTHGLGWKLMGRETLANFWLRLLGCPQRIHAEVRPGSPGSKSTLSVSIAPGASSAHGAPGGAKLDETSVEEWDISVVYVCGSHKEPDYAEYANLECDFAYGVFRADLHDALEAWVAPPDDALPPLA